MRCSYFDVLAHCSCMRDLRVYVKVCTRAFQRTCTCGATRAYVQQTQLHVTAYVRVHAHKHTTHTHTTHTLSLSRSLAHTHTHTHIDTHRHTHIHTKTHASCSPSRTLSPPPPSTGLSSAHPGDHLDASPRRLSPPCQLLPPGSQGDAPPRTCRARTPVHTGMRALAPRLLQRCHRPHLHLEVRCRSESLSNLQLASPSSLLQESLWCTLLSGLATDITRCK
jgi:hypothetical protein